MGTAVQTYIAMIRGINVGGQKTIKMADLKALCESLGFRNVTTYIQSGNVVLSSAQKNPSTVGETIESGIKKKFGFDVTVVVRTPEELKSVVKKNPFVGRKGIDEIRLNVMFLDSKPEPALVKALGPLAAKSKDEYEINGREVYLHCPNGYGKTLLSNTFFEKNLKVRATTRNWNSVNNLLELAEGAAKAPRPAPRAGILRTGFDLPTLIREVSPR